MEVEAAPQIVSLSIEFKVSIDWKGVAAYKELRIDAYDYVCYVTGKDTVQDLTAWIEGEIGIIKRISMREMAFQDLQHYSGYWPQRHFHYVQVRIPGMIKKAAERAP